MSVFSLLEQSQNKWQAKYQGNYGVYTIQITLDDFNNLNNYKCTCPSDFSPCKHIDMVLEKINEKASAQSHLQSSKNTNSELFTNLINGNTKDKFIDFLIEYSKYNDDFINKLKIQFYGEKAVQEKIDIYEIIRNELFKIDFDYDDQYGHYEESIELDILNEWFQKAKDEIESGNLIAAFEIAKALLEEYAIWLEDVDSELIDYIDEDYEGYSFTLFEKIIEIDSNFVSEIYFYLKTEFESSEINYQFIHSEFLSFFSNHSKTSDQKTDFLSMQQRELNRATDNYEKERILNRTIEFYNRNDFPEKAYEILHDNIEIDNFRKQIINKFILENKYIEAKKLLNDKLSLSPNHNGDWYYFLLKIAALENDTPKIREYSFHFLKDKFEKTNFIKYKATFSSNDWLTGYEILEKIYTSKSFFSTSLIEFWIVEKSISKILDYLTTHKSIRYLEDYYKSIEKEYPTETLNLFKNSINYYAKNNLGRDKYEYISSILKKMQTINGGKDEVRKMIAFYKVEYKNRPAMMEILKKVV